MRELHENLWRFVGKYFVSTADTPDMGLETMVFPAKKGAKIVEDVWFKRVVGVDFTRPYEEYTRHYKTVDEAIKGHKETVEKLINVTKGG